MIVSGSLAHGERSADEVGGRTSSRARLVTPSALCNEWSPRAWPPLSRLRTRTHGLGDLRHEPRPKLQQEAAWVDPRNFQQQDYQGGSQQHLDDPEKLGPSTLRRPPRTFVAVHAHSYGMTVRGRPDKLPRDFAWRTVSAEAIEDGGETGIRTLGRFEPSAVFKCVLVQQSATYANSHQHMRQGFQHSPTALRNGGRWRHCPKTVPRLRGLERRQWVPGPAGTRARRRPPSHALAAPPTTLRRI